jgi:hypothetical protein
MEMESLHDLLGVPEDGVGVEVGGGVEPEGVPHLPPADAAAVHVGLDDVGLAGAVAQELEVQLVPLRRRVKVRAHLEMTISEFRMVSFVVSLTKPSINQSELGRMLVYTYVVGGDDAGGVVADELELHAEPPEQVLLLRLEPDAWSKSTNSKGI